LRRGSFTPVRRLLWFPSSWDTAAFQRLSIYAHVLAEHIVQFERQRARILGTKQALGVVEVAEERQVA